MAIENARKILVDDTLETGYYIDDCTDPWKTPERIVMLPGCRKPRQVFYAWIPTLAREFQVLRPHMRGHWDSTPAPKDYEWTVDNLVTDIRNFLDAMELEKVHLVGESLGGLLGWHFAYRYPERLKTLTVVTSPGPSFREHEAAQSGSMDARHPVWGQDEKAKAKLMAEFGPELREAAEWGDAERWKSPVEATKGYFQAAVNCKVDEREILSNIKAPTLYMIGAECTRISSLDEARRLCGMVPRAEVVAFPGIKAQCQFVVPERCAEELVRFIKKQKTDG